MCAVSTFIITLTVWRGLHSYQLNYPYFFFRYAAPNTVTLKVSTMTPNFEKDRIYPQHLVTLYFLVGITLLFPRTETILTLLKYLLYPRWVMPSLMFRLLPLLFTLPKWSLPLGCSSATGLFTLGLHAILSINIPPPHLCQVPSWPFYCFLLTAWRVIANSAFKGPTRPNRPLRA